MTEEAASSWRLALAVPAAAAPLFEVALEGLGGAVVREAEADEAGQIALTCFLSTEPDASSLAPLLAAVAEAAGCEPPVPRVERLPDRDWVSDSQAGLRPLRSRRFWIHGSHDAGPAPAGLFPLLVDAGQAFGTGRHETTLGCLLAMEALAKRSRPARILDMGCGSGILALAAARLWPSARVLGVDNDAVAVAVARRHARRNGLARRCRFICAEGYRPEALRGRGGFDLVLANILARPLAAMAPGLRRRLAPRGWALLSGLLVAQEAQVLAPHEALELRLVRRSRLAEWSVLWLRAPACSRGAR